MPSHVLEIALAAALCAASCRTSADHVSPVLGVPTRGAPADHAQLTLGPNDVVRVGVYGHPELSSLPQATTAAGTRIDVEGRLSLPLVGAVPVGGLTVSEAHEVLTRAFAEYVRDPKLDVSVIEYGARRVYVFGEVRDPGAVIMDRPLTLGQCLALSGGFSPRANRTEIVLARGPAADLEVFVCDGEDPFEVSQIALLPDDLVFVRRSGAGKFAEEFLPILSGLSASLTSIGTLILIGDRLDS